MQIRLVVDAQNLLGEGPVWDVRERRLYWVDILGKALLRCAEDGSALERWYVPSSLGAAALREGGGAVLALRDGFYTFDFASRTTTPLAVPGVDAGLRFNDGKVDRRGRFFAGTMDDAERQPRGTLYRLDAGLHAEPVDHGFAVSNGPCWSPEGRTFYFSDSAAKTMFAYDFDLDTGDLRNRRVWRSTAREPGFPDGSTVDADGCVWTAHAYAGRVFRYTPGGDVDREIELPVSNVTSVAFGGDNLDVLYVTSMLRPPLQPDAPIEPHAGGVFAIDGTGAQGIPERRFAG